MSDHHVPFAAWAALALAAVTGASLPAQTKSGYELALERYRTCIVRKPFVFHTEGRQKLAETRRSEALQILVEDYAKPRDYAEYARYTLATLFGRDFASKEAAPVLATLRKQQDKPVDTWLWVQSLRIEADQLGMDEPIRIAKEDKSPAHRASALLALGMSKRPDLEGAITTNCIEFPKKEADRNLLLGAMTGALWENRQRTREAGYRNALKAYAGLLGDDVGLSHTAKVQIARHLQWILNAPGMFINAEAWIELIDRGEVKRPPESRTAAQSSFFGIETDGERIVYLVDMSDSMCKDIEPSAKPAGPITGPKQKKPKAVLEESDLPWHKIKTRWDLAREQLRISLSRLTPDKHFAIVWFGTEAGTLDATKGMVKATKGNLAKALTELDAIATGKPDPVTAPDGKLRGSTNLHAGLRLAFAMTGRGAAEEPIYVSPEALTEGCDTIFLLSDGAPSMDEFFTQDKDYGEGDVIVDSEYAAKAQRTPTLNYWGPYSQDDWLLEDMRRLNAFRRIRMHCVGLGEANMALLRQLADIGHGETFSFGHREHAGGGK